MVLYPVLCGEIAKRGIKKNAISKSLNISDRAFRKKMCGEAPFTWDEVQKILHQFFPDMTPERLFERQEPQPEKEETV